jgi:hypothetical protein
MDISGYSSWTRLILPSVAEPNIGGPNLPRWIRTTSTVVLVDQLHLSWLTESGNTDQQRPPRWVARWRTICALKILRNGRLTSMASGRSWDELSKRVHYGSSPSVLHVLVT